MSNLKSLVIASGAVLSLTVLSSTAGAQGIDPQIFVCNGCTASPGGDPNPIDPASINVGFDGSHTSISPLLIVVGVPNDSSATGPTISLPTGVSLQAAGTYYGAATNGLLTGERDGQLNPSPPAASTDAYSAVGLSGGNNSNNNGTTPPANWFASRDGNNDGTANFFGLYVYAINIALDNTGDAGQNSPINIDFTSIALGSYVIAYNCDTGPNTASKCMGNIGDTPFTNAGLVTTTHGTITTTGLVIPEPSALALLGGALAAMGFIRRRRKLV